MDNFKEDCLATNLNFVEANRLVEERRCWRSCIHVGCQNTGTSSSSQWH